MWGGWYNDPVYMAEMKEFLDISKQAMNKPMGSVSSLAVFIDEKAYKYCRDDGVGMAISYHFRDVLGKIGAPYDCYLASDYERVKDRYRALILLEPHPTELLDSIESDARMRGVGCYKVNVSNVCVSPTELREFCRQNGVHIYTDVDAVVFTNESYIFVHSCEDELPRVNLRKGESMRSLFESEATRSNHPKFASALYEIVR